MLQNTYCCVLKTSNLSELVISNDGGNGEKTYKKQYKTWWLTKFTISKIHVFNNWQKKVKTAPKKKREQKTALQKKTAQVAKIA